MQKLATALTAAMPAAQPQNQQLSQQTINSRNTPVSEQAEKCRSCGNAGYLGWKTPHAGYSLREVSFCECPIGQRTLEYWQRQDAGKRQKKLDQTFANAGIPEHFRDMTIETLIARAGGDKGKRDAIAAVKSFAEQGFIEDAATKRYKPGIILAGSFGRGKTGLLTPVLRHLIEQGKTGLWIEVYDFISEIQAGYENGTSLSRLEAAQRADVVLLDDLGDKGRDKPETDDRRRIVYQLINYRHNNGLATLITTNLSASEIGMQFGQRTVERIIESCAWVTMGGENLRMS